MTLPGTGKLVILAGGSLLLADGDRRKLMPGPLRAALAADAMLIETGTVYTGGPGLHTIPADLFRLVVTPRHPVRGGVMVFRLVAPGLTIAPALTLPGKRNTFFYQPQKQPEHWIARAGIDCQEKGREQPWAIRLQSGGLSVSITGSGLLHEYRTESSDIAGEYVRTPAPAATTGQPPGPSGHPLLSRKALDLFRTIPAKGSTKKKKEGPPLTRFVPTIQLPPEKRLLYTKKEDIAEESRIHNRSVSHSIPRQLWEGPFIFPGYHRFSSIFGEVRFWSQWSAWAHRGIDIAASLGSPVLAPNHGYVRFSGHTVLCGNTVILDHGQFVMSKIFHMLRRYVRDGEYVKKGQILGLTGSTGISTGPHIHWEMWVGSTKVDPNLWVLGEAAGQVPPLLDRKGRDLLRLLTPAR
jgi:murein DD-endopeptidase MepM/ murein hydrolase activator NlpD